MRLDQQVRGYTDMHCHVLPGVDDGSESMEESLDLIDAALDQGIREIIVTPHFHPGRYLVEAPQALRVLGELQQRCRESGRQITLYPGQECYYYSGLVDALHSGRAMTLAGSRYVLVEFDPEVLYSLMEQAMRALQQAGYVPVLAHFERYACLSGRPERLKALRSGGVLLQMNYDRLSEKDTFFHRNVWRRYFLEGYVDLLGSDSHGTHFRPLHADLALAWLQKAAPAELTDQVLFSHFDAITKQIRERTNL